MSKKKATATVQMEPEKWEQIKKAAKEKGVSASAYIRQCVYECLAKKA